MSCVHLDFIALQLVFYRYATHMFIVLDLVWNSAVLFVMPDWMELITKKNISHSKYNCTIYTVPC